MRKHFTYIIAGAGCSGMTMAWKLLSVLKPEDTVLVIDKKCADDNDRTWAFWHETNLIEGFDSYTWNSVCVYAPDQKLPLKKANYTYRMIQSRNFYAHIRKQLENHQAYRFVTDEITKIQSNGSSGQVNTKNHHFTADWVFNSCYPNIRHLPSNGRYQLIQQFCGYYIETPNQSFNANEAILMDFRMDQSGGTTFGYLLPLSNSQALVEFVAINNGFKPAMGILKQLNEYLTNTLGLDNFNITQKECGWLPMTDSKLNPDLGKQVINIGIIGGALKPSTGYSFVNTQKQIHKMVQAIQAGKSPVVKTPFIKRRFNLYDATFLSILHNQSYPGVDLFSSLFRSNKASKIFKFLNNDTSIPEEIRIFSTVKLSVFLPAIIKVVFGKIFVHRGEKETNLRTAYQVQSS